MSGGDIGYVGCLLRLCGEATKQAVSYQLKPLDPRSGSGMTTQASVAGSWIPAFAGMTGKASVICPCPIARHSEDRRSGAASRRNRTEHLCAPLAITAQVVRSRRIQGNQNDIGSLVSAALTTTAQPQARRHACQSTTIGSGFQNVTAIWGFVDNSFSVRIHMSKSFMQNGTSLWIFCG
jgi:hypothetical protein